MTDLMKKYQALQKQNPEVLLLFHIGDFYEAYFETARTIANVCKLTITTRDKGSAAIPMCGFPHHGFNRVVHTLTSQGYRVAVAKISFNHGPLLSRLTHWTANASRE